VSESVNKKNQYEQTSAVGFGGILASLIMTISWGTSDKSSAAHHGWPINMQHMRNTDAEQFFQLNL
jgi:hypothetical protein